MFERSKAFAVQSGVLINDSLSGPFITGGPGSPVGVDAPVGTVYLQPIASGFDLWEKQGAGPNQWGVKEFVAKALITEFFSSNAVSTTTSTAFQNKVNADTVALELGQYAIFWSAEYTNNNNNNSSEIRVRLNTVEIALEQTFFPSASSGQYSIRSAVFLTDPVSGVQNLQIQFRRVSGGTAAIRRATIGYIKVL